MPLTDIEQLYRDAERAAGLNYHRERVAVLASRLDCDKLARRSSLTLSTTADATTHRAKWLKICCQRSARALPNTSNTVSS